MTVNMQADMQVANDDLQVEGAVAVGSNRLFGERRKPINRDAAKIIRRIKDRPIKSEWTKEDEEAIRWAGAISKCPSCGDRAYEHGYCFGCGKPLAPKEADKPSSPNNVLGHSAAEKK